VSHGRRRPSRSRGSFAIACDAVDMLENLQSMLQATAIERAVWNEPRA
jgi:hypothetical protein